MNRQHIVGLMVLFSISSALHTVVFADERLVVKIAMFATGLAVGASISAIVANYRYSSGAKHVHDR